MVTLKPCSGRTPGIVVAGKINVMAYNEDSSASGHDEPWIQW